MKCFEIQNEIPEYLEDMLAENVRTKIRVHLSGCPACRSHAARLGSVAGDLKEIAKTALPFNLEQAVLEELSRVPSAGASFSGRKAAAVVFTLLCLAGLLKGGQETLRHFKQAREDEKKKIADEEAAAILEKLKQTDASLQRSAGEAGAKSAARRTVASLEPFDWHLKFPSSSERQVFAEKIKRMNVRTEFAADYMLAFSLDQDLFGKIVSEIEASAAVTADGPKADLKKLPRSETPLKVTFLMEAAGEGKALFWWQLRFLRQNSYLLSRRLHELEFPFLYESPHLILLQVNASQYKTLRSEIQEMLGLQIVRGQGDEAQHPQGEFPVVLFLQEG